MPASFMPTSSNDYNDNFASFVPTSYEDSKKYIDEFIKSNNLTNGRSSGCFDGTYYYDSPNGDTYRVCYLDGDIGKSPGLKSQESKDEKETLIA